MTSLRVYPTTCRSATCGRIDCTGCRHKPTLDEFMAWRERTKATRPDPVWSPTVWQAAE